MTDPTDDRLRQIRRALRHDLRNPLTIVLGRCELLESGALGPLDPRQVDSIRAITRNTQRLAEEIARLAELLDESGEPPGDAEA